MQSKESYLDDWQPSLSFGTATVIRGWVGPAMYYVVLEVDFSGMGNKIRASDQLEPAFRVWIISFTVSVSFTTQSCHIILPPLVS